MKYKIEKNIPIPAFGGIYPFHEMSVGDSFLVKKEDSVKARSSMGTANHSKKSNKKFCSRTQSNGDIRIWRTA